MGDIPDHGITNDLVKDLSSPVGFIIINWAFIDQHLSGIAEAIWGEIEKDALKLKRGRQYSEKAKALAIAFAELRSLSEYKDRFANLLEHAEKVTEIRHVFCHGTLHHFDPEKKVLTFVKVNPTKGRDAHEMEEVSISADNIFRCAVISLDLATELGKLATELVAKFLDDEMEK